MDMDFISTYRPNYGLIIFTQFLVLGRPNVHLFFSDLKPVGIALNKKSITISEVFLLGASPVCQFVSLCAILLRSLGMCGRWASIFNGVVYLT